MYGLSVTSNHDDQSGFLSIYQQLCLSRIVIWCPPWCHSTLQPDNLKIQRPCERLTLRENSSQLGSIPTRFIFTKLKRFGGFQFQMFFPPFASVRIPTLPSNGYFSRHSQEFKICGNEVIEVGNGWKVGYTRSPAVLLSPLTRIHLAGLTCVATGESSSCNRICLIPQSFGGKFDYSIIISLCTFQLGRIII